MQPVDADALEEIEAPHQHCWPYSTPLYVQPALVQAEAQDSMVREDESLKIFVESTLVSESV